MKIDKSLKDSSKTNSVSQLVVGLAQPQGFPELFWYAIVLYTQIEDLQIDHV